MKTVKKKVRLNLDNIQAERRGCGISDITEYTYTFTTHEYIPNHGTLEHFVEVEEPETMKEFLSNEEISKKELVEWLNKNY